MLKTSSGNGGKPGRARANVPKTTVTLLRATVEIPRERFTHEGCGHPIGPGAEALTAALCGRVSGDVGEGTGRISAASTGEQGGKIAAVMTSRILISKGHGAYMQVEPVYKTARIKEKERGRRQCVNLTNSHTTRKTPRSEEVIGLFFFFDRQLDARGDFAEQLDRNLIFADQLDGIRQNDLALLDRVALRGKRLGDVSGSYRAE